MKEKVKLFLNQLIFMHKDAGRTGAFSSDRKYDIYSTFKADEERLFVF